MSIAQTAGQFLLKSHTSLPHGPAMCPPGERKAHVHMRLVQECPQQFYFFFNSQKQEATHMSIDRHGSASRGASLQGNCVRQETVRTATELGLRMMMPPDRMIALTSDGRQAQRICSDRKQVSGCLEMAGRAEGRRERSRITRAWRALGVLAGATQMSDHVKHELQTCQHYEAVSGMTTLIKWQRKDI